MMARRRQLVCPRWTPGLALEPLPNPLAQDDRSTTTDLSTVERLCLGQYFRFEQRLNQLVLVHLEPKDTQAVTGALSRTALFQSGRGGRAVYAIVA